VPQAEEYAAGTCMVGHRIEGERQPNQAGSCRWVACSICSSLIGAIRATWSGGEVVKVEVERVELVFHLTGVADGGGRSFKLVGQIQADGNVIVSHRKLLGD
jgi:hypothetical protein